MSHSLFETHRETLERAIKANHDRTYWSAYPEIPSGKIYGENAKADGQAAHEARLGKPFEIDQAGTVGTIGEEVSPFGPALAITYPKADLDVLIQASHAAMESWKRADAQQRVGVCMEILDQIN